MLTIIKKMFRGKFKEAVEAVKRDPEVSEPVYMMIKGMKARPQDWRFRLVTKKPDHFTIQRGSSNQYMIVDAEVTDRRVGYTYRIQLEVDTSGFMWTGSLYTTSVNPMMVRQILTFPHWMTKHEMQALSYVLAPIFAGRLQKAQDRHQRARDKELADSKARAAEINRLERERVIQIYLEA